MKRKTRSILHELNTIAATHDRKHVIESRGENIIESAINLINEIHENFDSEIAGDLERRLINSIRNRNTKRFVTGVRRAGK